MVDKITEEEIQEWCNQLVSPQHLILNDKIKEIAEHYIEKGRQMALKLVLQAIVDEPEFPKKS